MKQWSSKWKASTRPRKQRNYRHKAPLHIKQKFVSAHLSKELRQKYGRRSLGVRKGDKVKVTTGQYKGKTGAVILVNLMKMKVAVEGIESIRKDGTKSPYLLEPSNLMITELMMDDKKRKAMLESKKIIPEVKKVSQAAAKVLETHVSAHRDKVSIGSSEQRDRGVK